MKFIPSLDKGFRPIYPELQAYRAEVAASGNAKPLRICIERNDGYRYVYGYDIFAGEELAARNNRIAERIIKTLLWVVGGYKIYLCGDVGVYEYIKQAYTDRGLRAFDKGFMERVYERAFEVLLVGEGDFPKEKHCSLKIGGHFDGCRIGFDAGGSDRKVSAVIDGEVVYSEEVVWSPKTNADPAYHYGEILRAMKTAAQKMPRVDAIGVSSAGVFVNNRIMVASLFLKVNEADFEKRVKNMYIDIAKEMGDLPLEVANDGDVSALAGAIGQGDTRVLGLAMGTSEAAGYINEEGGLNGWLSELAFVPVDCNEDAAIDEWSGDYGCGVKYFSQDGVIRLAQNAGICFDAHLTPAEKLEVIRARADKGDPLAIEIYENIGIYLGYTLPYYAMFYDVCHVPILGRVTSGKGGEIMIEKAKQVLREEFPTIAFVPEIPDESSRRVGQSIAAASLAKTRKKNI